jgi:hypothetical protein
MAPSSEYRVPQSGDSVRILSNGAEGRLVMYHQRKQSYEIQLASARVYLTRPQFDLLIKISDGDTQKTTNRLHILIPSHLERERDLTLLLRGIQSLLSQTDARATAVLGIGGKLLYSGADALRALLCRKTAIVWYLVEDTTSLHAFAQLPKLHDLSHELNANDAWLLFLKQTDLFHPRRIEAFRQVLDDPMTENVPFPLGAKLLLDETKLNTSEGQLQDFIYNEHDFDKWKGLPQAKQGGGIMLAANSRLRELNAHDYSDFCVPSLLFRRFLSIMPQAMLQNNDHCELRFCSMLDDMADLEPLSHYPWLLVAYSQTEQKRFLPNYSRSDWFSGNTLLDDPSVQKIPMTDFDRRVARHKISPIQVALVRIHMDAMLVQYSIWNDLALDDCMIKTIREVDLVHGRGFGKVVWQHCEERVRSYFSSEEVIRNREWSDGTEWTPTERRSRSIRNDSATPPTSSWAAMCCGCIRSWMT